MLPQRPLRTRKPLLDSDATLRTFEQLTIILIALLDLHDHHGLRLCKADNLALQQTIPCTHCVLSPPQPTTQPHLLLVSPLFADHYYSLYVGEQKRVAP